MVNSNARVQFAKAHGEFNRVKVFSCDGGAGGFTLHLSATFDQNGSVGSWAVTGSWGRLAGLHGAGDLVGFYTDTGIDDHYRGTLAS